MGRGKLPAYRTPPLDEVICGVVWESLIPVVCVGAFREIVRSEYPKLDEHSPLSCIIERFDEPGQIDQQLTPAQTRSWLISEAEGKLIQLQQDRFLYNWRRLRSPGNLYPRYNEVFKEFSTLLNKFEIVVQKATDRALDYSQYELTYVNIINRGEGWNDLADVGTVFPDVRWSDTHCFLGTPEGINWSCNFVLPEKAARLRANVASGWHRETKDAILRFELTVRGMASDSSEKSRIEWFAVAHEWIVKAFGDLTSETVQRDVWGREET